MKNLFWLATGICAAAVGILIWGPQRTAPMQELAHKLEQAWADNHTVA